MTGKSKFGIRLVCAVLAFAVLAGPLAHATKSKKKDPADLRAEYLTRVQEQAPVKEQRTTGSLWTNGGVPAGGTDVQRGSLELANATMETFFQQPSNNCFTCHQFQAAAPLCVSHIINGLLASPPCQ